MKPQRNAHCNSGCLTLGSFKRLSKVTSRLLHKPWATRRMDGGQWALNPFVGRQRALVHGGRRPPFVRKPSIEFEDRMAAVFDLEDAGHAGLSREAKWTQAAP
jgi:hypothetical protein